MQLRITAGLPNRRSGSLSRPIATFIPNLAVEAGISIADAAVDAGKPGGTVVETVRRAQTSAGLWASPGAPELGLRSSKAFGASLFFCA